jgi:hypothetical protein
MSRTSTEEARRQARGNHRATVRYRCAPATPGKLYIADDQEYQRAWIMNLSKTGVGLVLPRPLAAGILLVIRMRGANGPVDLPAHVVHSTSQSPNEWMIGCELLQPLQDEVLDTLL